MPDKDLNLTSRRGNGAPTLPPPPSRGRPTRDLPADQHRPEQPHGSTRADLVRAASTGTSATQNDAPEASAADGAPAAIATSGVLGLSLTGILGGALAAVSAAALGARLGVAGTLGGAAIGSIFSAVTAAAYTHSLRRTRAILRGTRDRSSVLATGTRVPADARPGAGRPPVTAAANAAVPAEDRPGSLTGGAQRDRPRVARIAGLAVALFASVIVIVTGIELGIGRSLDGSGSTTVGEVARNAGSGAGRATGSATDPTPAGTPSSTPSFTGSGSGTETTTPSPTSTSTSPASTSASTTPSSSGTTSSSPASSSPASSSPASSSATSTPEASTPTTSLPSADPTSPAAATPSPPAE